MLRALMGTPVLASTPKAPCKKEDTNEADTRTGLHPHDFHLTEAGMVEMMVPP